MPTTAELDWTPTRHAILGSDPGLQLYGEVSVWFHKLQLFRRGEQQRIFDAKPTGEDTAIHKQLLQRLLADGEHLLRLATESGLIENSEKIKIDDLRAALEGLRATHRGFYEPLSPIRAATVLREVFPDVA